MNRVETTLMAAICNDPDDILPRLAYCDYLEEGGQSDKADFIRTHIQLMNCMHKSFPKCECVWEVPGVSGIKLCKSCLNKTLPDAEADMKTKNDLLDKLYKMFTMNNLMKWRLNWKTSFSEHIMYFLLPLSVDANVAYSDVEFGCSFLNGMPYNFYSHMDKWVDTCEYMPIMMPVGKYYPTDFLPISHEGKWCIHCSEDEDLKYGRIPKQLFDIISTIRKPDFDQIHGSYFEYGSYNQAFQDVQRAGTILSRRRINTLPQK